VREFLYASVGVVLIVTAIPLILRRVPRNGVYGVRFAATLTDDWVWYEANAKGGRDLLLLGIILVVAPFVLSDMAGRSLGMVMAGLVVVGSLGVAEVSWLRSRRLLAQRRIALQRNPDSRGTAAGR